MEKLPKELRTGEDIVGWMRFLNGKTREEFERMAGTSEYFGEAYEALQRLSADERKRLEYEQRDKALKDYNSQMDSARSRINNGLSLLFIILLIRLTQPLSRILTVTEDRI